MSRSAKPRKAYKPKHTMTNVLGAFAGMTSTTHADHLQKMKIWTHGALANFAQGNGARKDWDRLVDAMNLAIVLSERGVGPEFQPHFVDAREALLETAVRAAKNSDRFLFRGDELKAMNEAIDCYDAQLENVRAIDLELGMDEVERRLKDRTKKISVRKELAKRAANAA